MKKIAKALVVAILGAGIAAGEASASSNYPDGTVVSATNSGGIAISGIITCNASSAQAPLTNLALGSGITLAPTSWTFGSCNSPVAACNLSAWDLVISGGGPTVWTSVWNQMCLDVTIGGPCRYQGNLSSPTFDESTDAMTLSGSLARTSGGLSCPGSISLVGKYVLSPSDLDLS